MQRKFFRVFVASVLIALAATTGHTQSAAAATASPSASPPATATAASPATSPATSPAGPGESVAGTRAQPPTHTINRGAPASAADAGKSANTSTAGKATPGKSPDIFVPTEEVPGDKAVAFPVDI